MAKFEKATVGEKVAGYVETRQKVLFSVLVAVVAAVVVFAVAVTVKTKNAEKGLSAIDLISYTLTENSSSLDDEALAERKKNAISALEEYNRKGGVVGVRANMLSAEIAYSDKDYGNASSYWVSAVNKGKKSYTSPICAFNAATCFENLGDYENAEKYYKMASGAEDFLLASRANFSLGRVREARGDKDGAIEAYNSVVANDPDSSWADLAKTRLIKLDIE